MIISNVIGGLGNQMFQYAAGRALALQHQTELFLDTADFDSYRLHSLLLMRLFPTACKPTEPATTRNLIGFRANAICKKILRKLNSPKLSLPIIFEPSERYWQQFSATPDNVYLDGYWQSESYFSSYEKQIRTDFTFPPLQTEVNQALAAEIAQSTAVSLHIRRGDYVSQAVNQSIYYQCDMDYYRAAIAHINANVRNPRYFVFSDDIAWAKTTFAAYDIYSFVSHNTGDQSYVDMQLMSLCKHNIIANSTFSWWGAWLNDNQAKIVISPREWFVNGRSSKDLIPETWVQI